MNAIDVRNELEADSIQHTSIHVYQHSYPQSGYIHIIECVFIFECQSLLDTKIVIASVHLEYTHVTLHLHR